MNSVDPRLRERLVVRIEMPLYHETQSLQFCGLHAVNNLLQSSVYTKKDFDKICYELTPSSWFNPHRSLFGTGNYDVNVIMRSLYNLGYTVKWFDRRRDIASVDFDSVFGLIVNFIANQCCNLRNSKHWISIRKIDGTYYNLDSGLQSPEPFSSVEEMVTMLKYKQERQSAEILLIYPPNCTQEVEHSDSSSLSTDGDIDST